MQAFVHNVEHKSLSDVLTPTIFLNSVNKTENRGKLTTVEILNLPKYIFAKGEKILGQTDHIEGNQIFSDDLISTNFEIKQGKLDLNFAASKKQMWVYDSNCVVRYMPSFKSVILNSRTEIRIFDFNSSKPVRRCVGNCILQINEQSPDCTKNIIKNPYSMEQIDFKIDLNTFELKNSSYDSLSKELELKLLNEREDLNENELVQLNSQSKSTIDQHYFWIMIALLSLLTIGCSLAVYCCYKKQNLPIRYISWHGLIFKN